MNFDDLMQCGLMLGSKTMWTEATVRPWDARFLGYGKTHVAQNLCNLSYLIRQSQKHQKTMHTVNNYSPL